MNASRTITALVVTMSVVLFIIAGRQVMRQDDQQSITGTEERRTTPILRETDPRQGPSEAPIVLVEYSDFSCPGCRAIQPIVKELLLRFPNKILHVWKDFPLPSHVGAEAAHRAARCAQGQGKFWEYHDALFAEENLLLTDFTALADGLGLQKGDFTACIETRETAALIRTSFAEGIEMRIEETPTLFVNDIRLTAPVTLPELKQTIEAILRKS